jgi:hypothetical protein
MKFATSIPEEVPSAIGNGGARRPKGKTDSCDEALGKPKKSGEQVVDAVQNSGAAGRAIDLQVFTFGDEGGGGSDPHKRSHAVWGRSEKG